MPSTSTIKSSFFGRVGKTFLAGLIAALPLALTIIAVIWVAELIHRYLGPNSFVGGLLGSIGLNFVSSELTAYLIGVGTIVVTVYLLGAAVEAGMKNRWRNFIASLFARLPLVRSVYQTLARLFTMFDKQDKTEFQSMSAVLIHFGGDSTGTAVLALLTNPEPLYIRGKQYYAVIIPTAPIPFGGAILYAPEDWVEKVDFGFDGLLNIYMSMGVTSPDYFKSRPHKKTKAT